MTITDLTPSTNGVEALPDSNRVALPDGEWVVLRDVKALRNKDRKVVLGAVDDANAKSTAMGLPPGQMSLVAAMELAERIAGMVITEWSFHVDGSPLAIPRDNPGAFDELTSGATDALFALVEPYMKELNPDSSEGVDSESRQGFTGT